MRVSEELLRRARALDPDNPRWSERLAHIYEVLMKQTSGEAKKERAAQALAELEIHRSLLSPEEGKKDSLLRRLARIAVETGDAGKATGYATEILNRAPHHRNHDHYGDDVHVANLILGRVALRSGDVERARTYLIEAGKTPGSKDLKFSGPDMTLAKELLEKGERDIVIEYFQLCARFWERHQELLDYWTAVVKDGGIPNFETRRVDLSGAAASDFTLNDLAGKEYNLKSLRGHVVLLDFWATWCGPCRVELPHIEKLHREFKDKGLVVLGVNNEPPGVIEEFVKKNDYTFPTLVDGEGEVARRYHVTSIPVVVVIDKEGTIVTHYVGARSEGDLRAALKKAGIE